MSNFILRKDLPFAKAGSRIDSIRSSKGTEELSYIKIGNFKCQLPDEVNIFDWIEEIKPRELRVIYTIDDKEIHSIIGLPQIPRSYYEDLNDDKHKSVLFREVIEGK